jgi:hypothetical protein
LRHFCPDRISFAGKEEKQGERGSQDKNMNRKRRDRRRKEQVHSGAMRQTE